MMERSDLEKTVADQPDGPDWRHKVADIRDKRSFKRAASEAECLQFSEILGDAKCLSLSTSYDVLPLAPGRYRLVGSVKARIEQICGVTLDPIEQKIDETFDIEFHSRMRSGSSHSMHHEPDFDALADDDPEPIEYGEIRVGRFVCELVASAIDPFPRAPDAELEQMESGKSEKVANPFAVLKNLKGEA